MSGSADTFGLGKHPVPAEYLVRLQEFAAEKGLPPQVVLHDTGLPLTALLRPRAKIGHESMEQAVRNVAEALDDPSLAIEYGQRLTLETHGALGFAVKNSATLAEAVELVAPYIRTRTGGREEASVVHKQGYTAIRWRIIGDVEPEVGRFSTLLGLMSIDTIGRRLVGEPNSEIQSEICLTYESPGEIRSPVLPPGLTITFGQLLNELRFPSDVMDRPFPHADPNLAATARAQLEAELTRLDRADVATRVRLEIRETEGPLPSIEQVAVGLHMSTRTLQRRLVAAGTTYQKIKDSERFRRAIHLMETTELSLERIAEALGYSDASNFTKAFKSWAGLSPGAYRAAL